MTFRIPADLPVSKTSDGPYHISSVYLFPSGKTLKIVRPYGTSQGLGLLLID